MTVAAYEGVKFKKLAAWLIADIVRRHTPPGWTVVETKNHTRHLSGAAWADYKQISIPTLTDVLTVYIFLHECAHVHLGHFIEPPPHTHVQEFQAERMAMAIARAEGLRLPGAITREAKRYVRYHIALDEAKGVYIEPRIRRWATPKE